MLFKISRKIVANYGSRTYKNTFFVSLVFFNVLEWKKCLSEFSVNFLSVVYKTKLYVGNR